MPRREPALDGQAGRTCIDRLFSETRSAAAMADFEDEAVSRPCVKTGQFDTLLTASAPFPGGSG
jgi:hypothetical protein